jgi:hypothetical protein
VSRGGGNRYELLLRDWASQGALGCEKEARGEASPWRVQGEVVVFPCREVERDWGVSSWIRRPVGGGRRKERKKETRRRHRINF